MPGKVTKQDTAGQAGHGTPRGLPVPSPRLRSCESFFTKSRLPVRLENVAENGQTHVTQLLDRIRGGDTGAADELFSLVYDQLHALAEAIFVSRSGHTLPNRRVPSAPSPLPSG